MNLNDKIIAEAEKLGPQKAKLDALQKQLEQVTDQYGQDDSDESLLVQMEALSEQIEKLAPEVDAAQKRLDMLRKAEQSMASRARPVEKAPAFTHGYKEPDHKAGDFFVKAALVTALSHINRQPTAQVIEDRYSQDERTKQIVGMLTKTAIAPADTTTADWAAPLVRNDMRGFLDMMKNRSIGAGLAVQGMLLDFAGAASITIPRINDIGAGSGLTEPAWVGEGGHIPLQKFSLGSATIARYKLASIVPLTMELAEMSTPAAEGVFRSAMEESYSRMLDTALLSNVAAVAGVRPAGLLNGAATAAGDSTGGYESVIADIKAMLGTFASNGMGQKPVLILNDQDFLGVGLLVNPLGQMMFASDTAANQLLGIPVLHSRNVTQGTAIMVDASVFVSAFDGPMFRVSQEATLTMANADGTAPTQAGTDATPGAVGTAGQVPRDSGIKVAGNTGDSTTGYQAINLFQTYSEAIRGIWPTSWSLVRSNAVVTRTSIAW